MMDLESCCVPCSLDPLDRRPKLWDEPSALPWAVCGHCRLPTTTHDQTQRTCRTWYRFHLSVGMVALHSTYAFDKLRSPVRDQAASVWKANDGAQVCMVLFVFSVANATWRSQIQQSVAEEVRVSQRTCDFSWVARAPCGNTIYSTCMKDSEPTIKIRST